MFDVYSSDDEDEIRLKSYNFDTMDDLRRLIKAKTEKEEMLQVPDSFRCPLSLELMYDPVLLCTESGQSFEKVWLVKALQANPKQDPMTGLNYAKKLSFAPNRSLKQAIEEWKGKNNYRARPLLPPEVLIEERCDSSVRSGGPAWLQRIIANDSTLTELYLTNNNLGDKGAQSLATALSANTYLQKLFLSMNNISHEGAEAIANALSTSKTLRILYIWHNDIGPEGAKSLAKALKSNTSLETLYLWNNNIGNDGADAIANALETTTSLKSLHIKGNRLCSRFSFSKMAKSSPSVKTKLKKIAQARHIALHL
mmetsp:Transcript_23848/g.31048  ORF Transcript_23848/g.31048 Transcript_23848/m.31048 type:complete len:311 (+) Transcript_23848:78-1010(+)